MANLAKGTLMNKRNLFIVFFIFVLLLGSCKTQGKAEDLTPITLNLTYIPNVQFAPFYVGIEKGFFADAGLNVQFVYGNEADMIALVGAGKETFMIASGEQVLMARGQGLPVISVANWYKDYPVGVASLKEAHIQTVEDLKGKTIGLPGLFGASYIGFEALARAAKLQESDYSLNAIGFTQVESLVTEQVDAVVVYVANEPVQLKARGYDINLLKVADSVDLVGNCLVTNENTTKEKPALVKALTQAVLKSIRYTAENPNEAFEICKNHVDNLSQLSPKEQDIQRQVLKASIDIWQTEVISNEAQSQKWQAMLSLLMDLKLMDEKIAIEGTFSDAFDR